MNLWIPTPSLNAFRHGRPYILLHFGKCFYYFHNNVMPQRDMSQKTALAYLLLSLVPRPLQRKGGLGTCLHQVVLLECVERRPLHHDYGITIASVARAIHALIQLISHGSAASVKWLPPHG